jgi:hypothetical protein
MSLADDILEQAGVLRRGVVTNSPRAHMGWVSNALDKLATQAGVLIDNNAALTATIESQKAHIHKLEQLARQRWSDGLLQGQSDAKHCFERAAKQREEYLDENEKLTNILLAVEAERDALKAKLARGVSVVAHITGDQVMADSPHRFNGEANALRIFDEGDG